jgi:hypothetical protein
MGSTSGSRLQRAVALVAAAVLVAFGIASIIKGLDGRSTVNSSLKQERVKGEPFMSPAGIVARAKAFGFTDFKAPDCSVANKPIATGSDARCFAQYMRIDALVATGGKTYADMPAFVGKDGKLTDDIAKAKIVPGTGIVANPARALWVTETALTTALNASYMGDQISLFGIGVGAVMLLLGLVLGAVSLGGVRIGQSEARRAQTLSRT